jgi:hypothetical protein
MANADREFHETRLRFFSWQLLPELADASRDVGCAEEGPTAIETELRRCGGKQWNSSGILRL